MTEFTKKSFSVALGLSEQGKENYDRIFKKKEVDEWTREVPLTPEELAAYRLQQIKWGDELGLSPDVFTCDNCALAPKCKLAFDGYNTDGDCLYSK